MRLGKLEKKFLLILATVPLIRCVVDEEERYMKSIKWNSRHFWNGIWGDREERRKDTNFNHNSAGSKLSQVRKSLVKKGLIEIREIDRYEKGWSFQDSKSVFLTKEGANVTGKLLIEIKEYIHEWGGFVGKEVEEVKDQS